PGSTEKEKRCTPTVPKVTPPECYTIFPIGGGSRPRVVSKEKFIEGKSRVRDIQLIQFLARKLSHEHDPRKIADLIDELRSAASSYIDSTETRKGRQSAAGCA